MRGDAVAKRSHAPRIVADALEGQAKLRSDDVAQTEVGGDCGCQADVIEERWVLTGLACGAEDPSKADVPAKDVVVLQDDVEEAHG